MDQIFGSSKRFDNNDHSTENLLGFEEREIDDVGTVQNQALIKGELELQQEVDFLENSRKSGEVVYLLGESQVSARKGSSFVKKLVVKSLNVQN